MAAGHVDRLYRLLVNLTPDDYPQLRELVVSEMGFSDYIFQTLILEPEVRAEILESLDLASIKNERELESRFVQPFQANYSLDEIRDFTNSTAVNHTVRVFQGLIGTSKYLDGYLDVINVEQPICTISLFLFAVTLADLAALDADNPSIKYFRTLYQDLALDSQPNLAFRFTDRLSDRETEYSHATSPKIIADSFTHNQEELAKLTDCLTTGNRIVRLSLNMLFKKVVETSAIAFGSRLFIGHTSQVIIDMDRKTAYLYEPSFTNYHLERIKEKSVEALIGEFIDPGIKVVPLQPLTCPDTNIQGGSSLCSVWSIYLFLVSISNPDMSRDQIFHILSGYSQRERDILILKFAMYNYYKIFLPNPLFEGKLKSRFNSMNIPHI